LSPLRIAFLEPTGWQYTVDTPLERPFGGSQSALCYLAVELRVLGHDVTIFNGIETPSESRGVALRNLGEAARPGILDRFDCVIVVNRSIGHMLRRDQHVSVPLILWTQQADDQPGISDLRDANEMKAWTGFAFVSDWQRERYGKTFGVPGDKARVLRNAVSPAFAGSGDDVPWFAAGRPPILFYSSTPFRGLDVLLQAFPAIRSAVPGTRLRVFSSMGVYQVGAADDRYRYLYERCKSLDGVEYVGSMGQTRLAAELAGTAALAYPSTFAETSCITALEAMAVGAAVLATRLGALPETTGGLAAMIDWLPDKAALARAFADATIANLRDTLADAAAAAAARNARIKFIRDNYLWPDRATEWTDWLMQLRAGGQA
jgi:glycosyltransferase involved in cell wall biosynthesis